jgi:hypothetical protein
MVTAEDDARHAPGPGSLPLWNESFWFAFYDPRCDIGVTVRLGMHPNRGEGNIYLVVTHDGGPVHSLIDLHGPVPPFEEGCLSLYGYTIEWEEPLQRFRLRYERGSTALDVSWEATSPAYVYPFPAGTTADQYPRHIEQGARVRGTVTVGGQSYDIDCAGHRDHSWGGERDWAKLPRWDYLSGEFGDGFWFNAVNVTVTGFPAPISLGGLWDGSELLNIKDVRMSVRAADGGTRQAGADIAITDERGDVHEIACDDVLAIAPVWFGRTCIKDGFARYRYRDRTGYGILERGFVEPFPLEEGTA